MTERRRDVLVGGVGCAHWTSPLDMVAIRFYCCAKTYPCLQCHSDAEDHPVSPWPREEFDTPGAVLCRSCGHWMSVAGYLTVGRREQPACPVCGSGFNPGCGRHAHVYFDTA